MSVLTLSLTKCEGAMPQIPFRTLALPASAWDTRNLTTHKTRLSWRICHGNPRRRCP